MSNPIPEKITVWVDGIPPMSRKRISTLKRYEATKIKDSETAYVITDDNDEPLIINPACDKHNLKEMSWNQEVRS